MAARRLINGVLWVGWLSVVLREFPTDGDYWFLCYTFFAVPLVIYVVYWFLCYTLFAVPLIIYVVSFMVFMISEVVVERSRILLLLMWPEWLLHLLGLFRDDKSVEQYTHANPAIERHVLQNKDEVMVCTDEGLDMLSGFINLMLKAYQDKKSWAGNLKLEHLRMSGQRCRIEAKPALTASFDNLLLDLAQLAKLVMRCFKYSKEGEEKYEKYVEELFKSMTNPPVCQASSDEDKAKFLKFLTNHPGLRSVRRRKVFISDIFQACRAMGPAEKSRFETIVDSLSLVEDWRLEAQGNKLLKRALIYKQNQPNSTTAAYLPGPNELFRFLRNFQEHGGDSDHSGQQTIGDLEDLEFIAADYFAPFIVDLIYQLVMQLDMGGLLRYAWRNYA